MNKILLTLVILLTALPVMAQEQAGEYDDWSKPTFARIDVAFSSADYHARWDISRCECGDLHIRAEETLPGEILKGEQLLIDNKVLLVKGYHGFTGPLPALLDSPVLMMQLLFVLLQETEPSGPSAVSGIVIADETELSRQIEVDSGTAYGVFPAPWVLSGAISPQDDGRIRFGLQFEFEMVATGASDKGQQVSLTGHLDYSPTDFPVDDSLVLDGWSAAWLNPGPENQHAPQIGQAENGQAEEGESEKGGAKKSQTLGEFKATL